MSLDIRDSLGSRESFRLTGENAWIWNNDVEQLGELEMRWLKMEKRGIVNE